MLTIDNETESAEGEVDHDEHESLLHPVGEEGCTEDEETCDEVDGDSEELLREGREARQLNR